MHLAAVDRDVLSRFATCCRALGLSVHDRRRPADLAAARSGFVDLTRIAHEHCDAWTGRVPVDERLGDRLAEVWSHTAWETWTALEFGGTANAPTVAAVCTHEAPTKHPLPGLQIPRSLQRPLLMALDPRSVDRLDADAGPPSPSPSPSGQPETRQAPPPILQSPNSVSPEPRPPFPNQHPPDGDDQGHGGLLGRLGL
jgi:hypothetical protein